MSSVTRCPICSKSYTYISRLETHIENKHSEYHSSISQSAISLFQDEIDIDDDDQNILQEHFPIESFENADGEWNYELGTNESNSDMDVLTSCENEIYPMAGSSIGNLCDQYEDVQSPSWDPWAPFSSPLDFKLARYFIESKTPKTQINKFFNSGLGPSSTGSFASGHTLYEQISKLHTGVLSDLWETAEIEFRPGEKSIFYFRDPVKCIEYLIRQKAYEKHLKYAPERQFNEAGERMYSEMHTSDWWWEVQTTLPEGATLIPILCASDQTHLTNFSGDKKAWPIYLTIGNLPSDIRNRPSYHAVLLLALLPVPPKFAGISRKIDEEQRGFNTRALHSVLDAVMRPLQDPGRNGKLISCADGKVRKCYPIVAGWIADHMEHATLNNLGSRCCPKCEVDGKSLGESSIRTFAARDHRIYNEKFDQWEATNDTEARTFLTERGLKLTPNAFWKLPRVDVASLHKPDLLHNIYLGLLKHLMDWIQAFLKKYARLQAFDDVWKSVHPYPGFTHMNKPYRQVSQWQGKEMRNLGRIILPCFAIALRSPSPSQRLIFHEAILCVRSFVDFHLMAQYRSHTPETIRYLIKYLEDFHRTKDVFLEFRRDKRTSKLANDRVSELRAEHQLSTLQSSGSKRQKLDKEHRQYVASELENIHRSMSHFNFIKLHLLSHFAHHITQFGSMLSFSTEIGETCHKEQIKDGFRRSNHVNATKQILATYERQRSMEMRILTLTELARQGHYTKDTADVLQLLENEEQRANNKANRAGESWISSNDRLVFKDELQHNFTWQLGGGKNSLQTVQSLVGKLGCPDLTHLLKMFGKTMLDQQQPFQDEMRTADSLVKVFTNLKIPVVDFQSENNKSFHIVRCTGSEGFRQSGQRLDWVWVQLHGAETYGDLRGRLPGRLECLFRTQGNDEGHGVERGRSLALVRLLEACQGGKIQQPHGLVRVSRRTQKDLTIVCIDKIVSAAHLVAEDPTLEENCKWLVNSRIDLRTFNEIY